MPNVDTSASPSPASSSPARRSRLRVILWAGAALVALVPLVAYVRYAVLIPMQWHRTRVESDPDEHMVIDPSWHRPAHPYNLLEVAAHNKVEGLKACHEQRWAECDRLLRMAQGDDEALERDPVLLRGLHEANAGLVRENAKLIMEQEAR